MPKNIQPVKINGRDQNESFPFKISSRNGRKKSKMDMDIVSIFKIIIIPIPKKLIRFGAIPSGKL